MNFNDKSRLTLAAMVLAAGAWTSTASAQEGAAGAFLEEIVTTARKRSTAERVQDVPVAISAFGAEQLEALFVTRLDDMSYLMPNVQLEDVGTFPGVQNFSIRGQGINSSIPSVDPTVGVFVDGVYIGTTFGVVIDTFDLESVEVLRGPQGLLFGRNVTGGAVLLRTKRPTGDFGARVRVGGNNEEQYNIAASIEGSLIEDRLAAKLVAYYDDDNGYFPNTNQETVPPAPVPGAFYFNPATGRNVGQRQTTLVRPTFVLDAGRSEWTLIAEYGESEGDGAVWANVTAQQAGAQPKFETTLDEMGFMELDWTQLTLETNVVEVGNGTLTNIFGYRDTTADSGVDIDGTNLPIFAAGGLTEADQISNELRWTGSFSDSLDATFGLYYFDQDIKYREGRIIQGGAVLLGLGGDMSATNVGVFGSIDYHFGNNWIANFGLRYTDESKDAAIFAAGCFDIVAFDCATVPLTGDWDNVTPRIGLEKELSDNARVYGFWTKGFRSGGFNFRNARPDVIPPGPTKEEENNTFEIGIKSEFADGRMRLNVAAFHNEISDMQRELNLPDPFVVVLQGTINAGDVTIQGVEADFVGLLTDNFSINISAGWQDGEYDSIAPIVGDIEDDLGFTVLGPDLPRLAPFNYSLGFSWDIPMGSAGLVNVAANHSYRDENAYNDSNTEYFDEQRRTNASVNYFSPSENWQVSLYGKNISNEANWGNLTSIAGLFTAGPMQKGRLYGLEVNFRY
jgi:iron complex outermembrane receptor protein